MHDDREIDVVRKAVLGHDTAATQSRFASVLRGTIDQLLDGRHTGRYKWSQLFKTEKTHAGTLVEINLQREFRFSDGETLDFSIQGIEVDCKYSQSEFGWMLPPEAIGHLCLLVWASDEDRLWSCGLARADEANLTKGHNRDMKKSLSAAGRENIVWLFRRKPLPPNVFLDLLEADVVRILDPDVSGQQRVNRLFVLAQKRVVGRGAVATAAQQDDYMKRVRYNGGSRTLLRGDGIVIFGHEHRDLVSALGLPVPHKGEFVSARVARTRKQGKATRIDGDWWRIALDSDKAEEAPLLPRAEGRDPDA